MFSSRLGSVQRRHFSPPHHARFLANPDDIEIDISQQDYGIIHFDRTGAKILADKTIDLAGRGEVHVPRLVFDAFFKDTKTWQMIRCGLQMKATESKINQSTVLRGRQVSPVVDVGLISKWIRRCCEGHGEVCAPAELSIEAKDIRIRAIDINMMCVVDLPTDSKYGALSYVWGTIPQLRLLIENYSEFTQPNGLKVHLKILPRTIMDTMNLLKRLGERYLWVDALCIIQDDPLDLAVQIQHMNVIYSCAMMTIVAASGMDSSAGLCGLDLNSRRSLVIDEEIQGIPIVTALPDFYDALGTSVWESRGWTMQEKVLSKRLVIFTEYQTFYHCNSATWCEDAIWESQGLDFQLAPGTDLLTPEVSHCSLPPRYLNGLEKYAHLVTGYHQRQLTHQSDALNAFTGALTALSKELQTPFILGLPESVFSGALLWRTPLHNPKLRREQFPSWTWLGWKASELIGDLKFPISDPDEQIIPLVHFYQVTNEGEQNQVGDTIGGLEEYVEKLPRFTHPSAFPRIPSSHFLRFWTWSAFIHVGRTPVETTFSRYGSLTYSFGIKEEEEGQWREGGRIALHEQWRSEQSDSLEFIVICKSWRTNETDKSKIRERLELMLIETRDEVSSRVQIASEVFMETFWKELRPKWRLVTLA